MFATTDTIPLSATMTQLWTPQPKPPTPPESVVAVTGFPNILNETTYLNPEWVYNGADFTVTDTDAGNGWEFLFGAGLVMVQRFDGEYRLRLAAFDNEMSTMSVYSGYNATLGRQMVTAVGHKKGFAGHPPTFDPVAFLKRIEAALPPVAKAMMRSVCASGYEVAA